MGMRRKKRGRHAIAMTAGCMLTEERAPLQLLRRPCWRVSRKGSGAIRTEGNEGKNQSCEMPTGSQSPSPSSLPNLSSSSNDMIPRIQIISLLVAACFLIWLFTSYSRPAFENDHPGGKPAYRQRLVAVGDLHGGEKFPCQRRSSLLILSTFIRHR